MKQLLAPTCTPDEAYTACTSAIIDDQQRDRMKSILPSISATAAEFVERAAAGSTWELPYLRLARGEDPFVVDDIRKSELVHLYEYYMVQRPPGRSVYDSILVAAGDHCPTCGGIGQPRTLDHYLPKANYPKLAVVPQNLIPACRDCNTNKRNPLVDHPHQQLLHPYLDKLQFSKIGGSAFPYPTPPLAPSFTSPVHRMAGLMRTRQGLLTILTCLGLPSATASRQAQSSAS